MTGWRPEAGFGFGAGRYLRPGEWFVGLLLDLYSHPQPSAVTNISHWALEISVGCSFQKPWNLPGPLVWLECRIVGKIDRRGYATGKSKWVHDVTHRCFLPRPLGHK